MKFNFMEYINKIKETILSNKKNNFNSYGMHNCSNYYTCNCIMY